MATEEENELLSQLSKTLETSIETLWKCAVITDQFTDTSAQPAFNDLVSDFVESLKDMDELSRGLTIKVPLRVVQKVDQGSNPDLVTKEYYDMCREKNDVIRGRLFATKVFEDSLRERLKVWEEHKPLE